ncbi:hypothetical protein [Streptomyces sp. KR55]
MWIARGSTTGPVTSGSTTISGTGAGLTRRYSEIDFGEELTGAHSLL